MCPPLPARRRVLGMAMACAVLATGAADAAAQGDGLRAAEARLAEREARLDERADALRAGLVARRVALDEARRRHEAALNGLERRLVDLYATPEVPGLARALVAADLGDARAGLDLVEAIGRRDRALVAEYRRSVAALLRAEAELGRRKRSAVAAQARVSARREAVHARLAARRAAVPTPLTAPLEARGELTVTTPFGLPAAGTPSPRRPGLPTGLVARRGLPGTAPVDAATGRPLELGSPPAGPAPMRALPGGALVSPAGGARGGPRARFTAVASWYGPGFERARTASGQPFDPSAFSAASRTLPFGTLLQVSYGGRSVVVMVNDRGPYVRGRDLDLSQAAAAALRLPGVGTVSVEVLPGSPPAPRPRRAAG